MDNWSKLNYILLLVELLKTLEVKINFINIAFPKTSKILFFNPKFSMKINLGK